MEHQKRCSNECTKEARKLYQREVSSKYKKPSDAPQKMTQQQLDALARMNNKYLAMALRRTAR